MNNNIILCVDDEPIVLLSIKMELISCFGDTFYYETATNGIEALEVIDDLKRENKNLFLVITDWLMPNMNGEQLLYRLDEISPDTHKIVITGEMNENELATLQNRKSVDRIFLKPWSKDQLTGYITHIADNN